jgi:hypothetical protein
MVNPLGPRDHTNKFQCISDSIWQLGTLHHEQQALLDWTNLSDVYNHENLSKAIFFMGTRTDKFSCLKLRENVVFLQSTHGKTSLDISGWYGCIINPNRFEEIVDFW